MPEAQPLAKAELCELDTAFANIINEDKRTKVQFNPDSLKVSFTNSIQQPSGSGDQNGPQAQQFVGAGSTKLAVTLTFDVTGEFPEGLNPEDDVRRLTQKVAYFITPRGDPPAANPPTHYIPPAVRFVWGSFSFDGMVESMEETLDYFSHEGRPLRATVALSITQQKITEFRFNPANNAPGVTRRGGAAPGTSPLTEAPSGSTLQGLASGGLSGSAGFGAAAQIGAGVSVGGGLEWQAIATANGIENPRVLEPGIRIDLNHPQARIGAFIGGR